MSIESSYLTSSIIPLRRILLVRPQVIECINLARRLHPDRLVWSLVVILAAEFWRPLFPFLNGIGQTPMPCPILQCPVKSFDLSMGLWMTNSREFQRNTLLYQPH